MTDNEPIINLYKRLLSFASIYLCFTDMYVLDYIP